MKKYILLYLFCYHFLERSVKFLFDGSPQNIITKKLSDLEQFPKDEKTQKKLNDSKTKIENILKISKLVYIIQL